MTTKNFVVKNGLSVGNVVIDASNGNITGIGNANLGNLAIANFFSGNGYLLTGIVSSGGNANYANFAGQVVDATQSNITAVGTLATLSVSGNAAVGGLLTNNLLYANGQPWDLQEAAGSNTQVQFNDGNNNFGASANFTFNNSTNTVTTDNLALNSNLTMSGTLTASIGNINGTNASFTGTVTGGNLSTGGAVSATGNVLGGNITTGGLVTATGNVTGGNFTTGGIVTATGTITGGNLITGGTLSAGGNANVGNIGIGGLVTAIGNVTGGNLTTGGVVTATGNITGGNLTTGGAISATGNATVGNISATNYTGTIVTVTGNVTGGNLVTGGILNVTGTSDSSIAGNLNMNGKFVSNIAYAVANTDAASKQYVDTMVSSGIAYHQPVAVATTTNLDTATGGTVSYNNGTAGVGATLTTTGAFLLIDGANVQTVGTRILVKDEANAAWNGIYEYTSSTVITRTTDADTYGPDSTTDLSINDYFFTLGGVINEGTAFVVSAPAGTITFGTSNITFAVFSTSQVYDAGTGIAITGTTISANASQTQVTAVGTLTSLSVSGNANIGNIGTGVVTATGNGTFGNISTGGTVSATGNVSGNYFIGNGSQLTGIDASGIQNGTSNIKAYFNSNVTVSVAGNANVATFTATGLNVLGTISTTGDANVGNLGTGGLITATGNIGGGNINTGGVVSATGNVAGGNLTTAGVVSATGNVAGGNLTTAGVVSATGNGTFGNVSTAGIVTATGNVAGGNLTTAGIVSATGNGTFGNISTAGTLSVTGNANVGNIGATTGVFTNVNTGNVTSSGNLGLGGNSTPNIVVVNNLGVTVTGNLSATGNITGTNADLGNLVTANYVNVSSNVITNNLTVNLEISGNTANFIGNIVSLNANLGNLAKANYVQGTLTTAAQPNITSVGSLASLSVVGTATVGNVSTAGDVSATGNVTGGNISTGGTISATGNVSGGNITTTGAVGAVSFGTTRSNVSVSAGTVIDQFNPATYRTAKYVISATGDNGYQSVETLLVHDGINSYITIYGSVCSNNTADIIDIASDINGISGNVTVYATASGASTYVNLVVSYIKT